VAVQTHLFYFLKGLAARVSWKHSGCFNINIDRRPCPDRKHGGFFGILFVSMSRGVCPHFYALMVDQPTASKKQFGQETLANTNLN